MLSIIIIILTIVLNLMINNDNFKDACPEARAVKRFNDLYFWY